MLRHARRCREAAYTCIRSGSSQDRGTIRGPAVTCSQCDQGQAEESPGGRSQRKSRKGQLGPCGLDLAAQHSCLVPGFHCTPTPNITYSFCPFNMGGGGCSPQEGPRPQPGHLTLQRSQSLFPVRANRKPRNERCRPLPRGQYRSGQQPGVWGSHTHAHSLRTPEDHHMWPGTSVEKPSPREFKGVLRLPVPPDLCPIQKQCCLSSLNGVSLHTRTVPPILDGCFPCRAACCLCDSHTTLLVAGP